MDRRVKKYLPAIEEGRGGLLVRQIKDGDDRIAVYGWRNNPVEVWAWNIGPSGPTRIDLRGLEQFPTQKQLEPALALFEKWKEQHRRDQGEIAGPGPPGLDDKEAAYRREKAIEAIAFRESDPSMTWKEICVAIGWRYGFKAKGIKKLERAVNKYQDDQNGH